MTALFVSAFLGAASTIALLFVKVEMERLFHRRKDFPLLHVVNVLVTGGVVAISYYLFSDIHIEISEIKETKRFFYVYAGALQLILPMYAVIALLFQQRRKKQRKYTTSKDKKVLYINEKYLARRYDDYHSKTS
ncbi:hypothetical protein [Thermaerobacillus caldiproteolyticus]|uniref:Protein-S-isoprenylcysteine O-methyltransferase Ste14 n=1 Tax=Thermaerobacillus caldiproteolyticus TaxID=247480 RepID=A0A7V9Z7D9_9BACL|nr:hypothetical protein [Anoxybacillus caldiproteolyticus]MBA2875403.1 protein-S-isoprenylcysteine O-methyltransferase Ste14 [Anoxybacillus caldiproteolyticus]